MVEGGKKMSRLSEMLCVKEGQEFRHGAKQRTYKVVGENFYQKKDGQGGWKKYSHKFIDIINRPDLIQPIPPNLTEQQITAIKGRIAEGTPWAARDGEGGTLDFYKYKPKRSHSPLGYFYLDDEVGYESESDLYDFITFENSPVYLPELIEGSEDK